MARSLWPRFSSAVLTYSLGSCTDAVPCAQRNGFCDSYFSKSLNYNGRGAVPSEVLSEPLTNMRIMEIIVDGFKSYAQRTVIGRFDPKFNAITGLNGSGKSNILDSICFVVRARLLDSKRV